MIEVINRSNKITSFKISHCNNDLRVTISITVFRIAFIGCQFFPIISDYLKSFFLLLEECSHCWRGTEDHKTKNEP